MLLYHGIVPMSMVFSKVRSCLDVLRGGNEAIISNLVGVDVLDAPQNVFFLPSGGA
jgi:hypothetical protein